MLYELLINFNCMKTTRIYYFSGIYANRAAVTAGGSLHQGDLFLRRAEKAFGGRRFWECQE
jgi:hypothetical protein